MPASVGHAQSALLSASVEPVGAPRTGAPMPVVWTFHWNGPGLLEGRLELSLRDGEDVLAHVVMPDVVLTGGEQRIRAVFPACSVGNGYGELTIRAAFVAEDETHSLGDLLLRVPDAWRRSLGIALCADWNARHPALMELGGAFRFEEFHPFASQVPDGGRETLGSRTVVTTIAPEDMPSDPLTECVFNIVVVDSGAWGLLRDAQWEALRKWVRAGGSLCLFAGDALSPGHVALLNELAGADADDPLYVLGPDGRLVEPEGDGQERLHMTDYGLGRILVVRGTPAEVRPTIDSRAWRAAAAHLWHVRSDQRAAIVDEGAWDPALFRRVVPGYPESPRPDGDWSAVDLSPAPLQTGHELLTRLMPRGLQVVPLSLVALILGGFVLLIGPGDYYLLGWLRKRKLTWITFPAVTVGVTLLTVWLTRTYMATDGARRGIVVRDIGEDGTVLRQSRIELLFTGTPQTLETELAGTLLTPVDADRLGRARVYYDPRYDRVESHLVGPPRYSGRLPMQYAVRQDIPQWTPQLNRTLTIAADEVGDTFDWRSLDPSSFENYAGHGDLRVKLQAAFGSGVWARLYRGEEEVFIAGGTEIVQGREPYVEDPYGAVYYDETYPAEPTNLLRQLSVRPRIGLFSIVSRVAPSGDAMLEDLALLDSSDPRQWLLVVAVEEGEDLVVYRRMYRTDEQEIDFFFREREEPE